MPTQQSYSCFKTGLPAVKTQPFSRARLPHTAPSLSQQQSTSVYCVALLKTTPWMCAAALHGATARTYSRTYAGFLFHTRFCQMEHRGSERNSCLQEMHACFLLDSRTISSYICDCPLAAASLKFLKQEGLWAALSSESVKLPGYRGNGLEGIFKDAVAQQLLQLVQMFSEVRDFYHLTAVECN